MCLDIVNIHIMIVIFPFLHAKKHVCSDHHKWSTLITHSDIDQTWGWNAYVIARLDLTHTPLQIQFF